MVKQADRAHATAAVVGAGPAGLMAAQVLAKAGIAVTVFEKMPSPARKLLMAGRGGLNLTHSEPLEGFLTRYGATRPLVESAISAFTPADLIAWAEGLGQETFVGSSGRIFPRKLKASPLLRAWLRRLAELGVALRVNHRWTGWNTDGALTFDTPDGPAAAMQADVTLLALGGASWPKLGSDGNWTRLLAARGVALAPLRASNCGVNIVWSQRFLAKHEGQPLKRIALATGEHGQRGEAVVTRTGLEGGAVYGLSAAIRAALDRSGMAPLLVDLRPDATIEELEERLAVPRGKETTANFLRKRINLTATGIGLVNELCAGKPPADPRQLASLIKGVPLQVAGLAGLDRAISTAGGIMADAVDQRFMLRGLPGVFVAGEMLDWDAPTGGYLLQATLATSMAAAHGMLDFLAANPRAGGDLRTAV